MNNTKSWYAQLKKPSWAPPSWLFGPVWTFLYIIIFITFSSVFVDYFKGGLPLIIALPFFLNIIFNLIYTPIQFGLKNNYLATLDIFLILGTLIWALTSILGHITLFALLNIPYLLWVSFATVLQVKIMLMNK